ncbi:MAG: glycosyltransferase family 39 protein [Armatimonadetes bacterium]|nr:glycosyltransferase family 39 protein [Armatimonadota bacterium]
MNRYRQIVFRIGILLGVVLRFVALGSDPYRKLSWSAALVTDEGFYLHNARNLILFGSTRQDEFQNSLIMPTLHFMQVGFFSLFGVGLLQARILTLLLSLLTLTIFYFALKRAFNGQTAIYGTLFLILDPVFTLYNRMALMDTPALLPMALAFYGFAWAWKAGGGRRSTICFAGCGAFLALAYTVRGLSAFLIPIPFCVVYFAGKRNLFHCRAIKAMGLGVGVVITLYLLFWWLPHRQELAHVNGFYLRDQLLPENLHHFASILITSLFGDDRGVSAFMLRQSPILTLLGVLGVVYWVREGRKELWEDSTRACMNFLVAWLVAGGVLFSALAYSPSRYYILFYPALAGVAGFTLVRLERAVKSLLEWRGGLLALGGWLGFHIPLAVRPLNVAGYTAVGVGVVLGAGTGYLLWKRGAKYSHRLTAVFALNLFLIVSALRLGDWARNLSYSRQEAEQWIQANIPPNSVLIGDMASGVAIDTRLPLVPVIAKLCNDDQPVEQYKGRPTFLVVLDGEYRHKYWKRHYPYLLSPHYRVAYFPRVVKYPIGIYRVDGVEPPVGFKAPSDEK